MAAPFARDKNLSSTEIYFDEEGKLSGKRLSYIRSMVLNIC